MFLFKAVYGLTCVLFYARSVYDLLKVVYVLCILFIFDLVGCITVIVFVSSHIDGSGISHIHRYKTNIYNITININIR